MMNCPPNPSQSGSPFSDTFEHLVLIRQALLKVLSNSGNTPPSLPRHSLFSSKKTYRSDELSLGLNSSGYPFEFSLN
jgi:hypothetical protein